MDEARTAALRQYVVLHLKVTELLHLMLLNFQLSEPGACPPNNILKHGPERFKETSLGAIVNTYMSISDDPKSTNARTIWKRLYSKHAGAIDRIWGRRIAVGEAAMRDYRDRAGAHGDKPPKYFAGKLELFTKQKQVLTAMQAFLSLSICLDRRQAKELPELLSEIEGVILDIELGLSQGAFNRKWLREMHRIQSGNFTKVYR